VATRLHWIRQPEFLVHDQLKSELAAECRGTRTETARTFTGRLATGLYPIFGDHFVSLFCRNRSPENMNRELRVLMVEDTAPDMVLINHELRKAGLRFRSRRVDTREAFLHEIESHPPDVILSDHGVPGFDGIAALTEARHRCPNVPFIFVTGGTGNDQALEEKLQTGADDYVLKTNLHLLAPAIDRALRDASTRARQKQIESALQNAEEHLRLVSTELKTHAAFMLDEGGRVASWNPGAQQLLHYEPNEILGRQYDFMFPGETRNRGWPQDLLGRVLAEGRIEESTWCVGKEGYPFRARIILIALGHPKAKRGFLCLLHDLTIRKTNDDGNESDERIVVLQAAIRELEDFTYAVARDLHTPLRHIETFAEILLKSAGNQFDPKSTGHLKTISESAQKMSRLVDDLFTFSRIGRADMYRLHLSLAEVVREVIHDLRAESEGREIEWMVGELPEVVGDPVMMWLAMTNLISNALKFSRPRPVARIEIGSSRTENEHVIFVRDNGVGFDAQQGHRLFKIFQRLHASEFDGSGVGLTNVRRIVQRHGGRVWAESTAEHGTTFYFSLPRTAPA
jgi:PAS domain S-box-containing protein